MRLDKFNAIGGPDLQNSSLFAQYPCGFPAKTAPNQLLTAKTLQMTAPQPCEL
jgi:hypothetical protein